ncbi:hypothetical protein HPG69_012294, partial [Diceros bicornis minor]
PKSHGSYRFLAPWIGYGLLLLNGHMWFQHWQMLTPPFPYDILKPYVGLMADSVQVMLDKWEELTRQDSHLETFGHISLMTLDTNMKCAFSHQGSVQIDRNPTPPPGQKPPFTPVSSASSPFRNSQSYIQATGDLNNLFFSWKTNALYQNNIIYRLTPDRHLSHQACQLAPQHTG